MGNALASVLLFFDISVTFALKLVLVAKPIVLGIFSFSATFASSHQHLHFWRCCLSLSYCDLLIGPVLPGMLEC